MNRPTPSYPKSRKTTIITNLNPFDKYPSLLASPGSPHALNQGSAHYRERNPAVNVPSSNLTALSA